MITTIILPEFSARLPTCRAAQTAAPEDMPISSPSEVAIRAGGAEGVLAGYLHDLIEDLGVKDGRDKSRTDALDGMRSFLSAGKHRRTFRFHGDDLEIGFVFLECFAHTGDGAARAHPGHQYISPAVAIVPDFLGSGQAVDFRIGRILKLPGQKGILILRGHLLRALDGARACLRRPVSG